MGTALSGVLLAWFTGDFGGRVLGHAVVMLKQQLRVQPVAVTRVYRGSTSAPDPTLAQQRLRGNVAPSILYYALLCWLLKPNSWTFVAICVALLRGAYAFASVALGFSFRNKILLPLMAAQSRQPLPTSTGPSPGLQARRAESIKGAKMVARTLSERFSLEPWEGRNVSTTTIDLGQYDNALAGRHAKLYKPALGGQHNHLIVYFHGGGWATMSPDAYHGLCQQLCARSNTVVLSCSYRLAPEHRFPQPLDDVCAALQVAFDHAQHFTGVNGDLKLVVGGDSAGGNLTAAACLQRARAGAPLPLGQILIYPVTDGYNTQMASTQYGGEECFLPKTRMDWYVDCYKRNDADLDDRLLSPVRASDSDLSKLRSTRTLLVLAGLDLLKDQGSVFGHRLQANGVPVEYVGVPDVPHGFLSMRLLFPTAQDETMTRIAVWVRMLVEGIPSDMVNNNG